MAQKHDENVPLILPPLEESDQLVSQSNNTLIETLPYSPSVHESPTLSGGPGRRDDNPHSTSNVQAMMNLLKGNIGTGILAMPVAVKNAGLLVGGVGVIIIGAIAVHCMHILVKCSHDLCHRTGNTALNYGQAVEEAFCLGPTPLRRCSKLAHQCVNLFLNITQMGFCCVYVLFIAENIKQVVDEFHSHDPLSKQVYMALLLVFLIPFVFVRKLKHLAPFATFANLLTVIGLIITFQYTVQDLPDISSRDAFNSWKTLPLFFGTAVFAFEGISLVLPIENKMKHPEDFTGLTGVLNTSMVVVTCLYTAVGFYGYLRYGNGVQGSITLNLPTDWLYLSVRIMFALAIFVSYGVQFYVPVEIIYPFIRRQIASRKCQKVGEYIFRVLLVLLSFTLAAVIPYLDLFISLIGAVSSSILALIIPPILEVVTFWQEKPKWFALTVIKDIFILLFGLAGFIVGTYVSLEAIVEKFSNSPVVNGTILSTPADVSQSVMLH